MLRVLTSLVRSSVWLLFSFVIVVAILALTAGLPDKIKLARAQAGNLERVSSELNARRTAFDEEARTRVSAANEEISRLRRAGADALNNAEKDLMEKRSAAMRRRLDEKGVALAALRGKTDEIVASYRAEYIEIPLADRALSLIKLRQQNLTKIADRGRQVAAFNRRIGRYNGRVNAYNRLIAQRKELQRRSSNELRAPVCRQIVLPIACKTERAIRTLDARIANDKSYLDREGRNIAAARAAFKALNLAELAVQDGSSLAAQASRQFGEETRRIGEESAGRVFTISQRSLRRYGWSAFWIVLGSVLLPVAHKLLMFLIVAPVANRARPVRIMPPAIPLIASGSYTAIDVPLDRDSELLVRSGVQSVSSDVSASDLLVLNKRMPFTCYAAGLVNLQRLRADRQDHVTVTAPGHDHAEIARIDIPNGGAVVLQPRALVGVLKPRSARLRISRPWRLTFLVSWITFQFRYVVFHGPCSLIVQGSRGVRVEEASSGRMINKRLTLGFDAGLAYGSSRSPTFLPYLRGEASLFNDSFAGSGRYLYEHRPQGGAKGTLWGRGLRGLGDAFLSALGI